MKVTKKRLDVLIYNLGLADSREFAKKLIMSGQVYADNQKADKPGMLYREDSNFQIRGKKVPYVSRGGLKLEKGINLFQINLVDKVAMDIGASTGGFTDCMIQNGAKKVYSIDVGYGQLAWKLRNDSRVINLERTNFRYIDQDMINDQIDFFSVDVSFISLKLILPVARKFLQDQSTAVCLIKPQFEAGRKNVGKNGVIRDPLVHINVINDIIKFCLSNGFSVLGVDFSPIKGPRGNVEYLIYIKRSSETENDSNCNLSELVEQANKI